MGFTVDMREKKIDDLHDPDAIATGFHRVVIEDTYEDPDKGDQVFKLKITGGKNDGAMLYYRLYNPANSEKPEKLLQCIMTIAKRLGVLTKEDEGKEIDLDFLSCIGSEMVANVYQNEYPPGIHRPKVDWYRLHGLDSEDIPAEDRKALGLPELEAHKKAAADKAAKAAAGGTGTGRGRGRPRKDQGQGQESTGAAQGAGAAPTQTQSPTPSGAIDVSDL